jgi:hypothetical protein
MSARGMHPRETDVSDSDGDGDNPDRSRLFGSRGPAANTSPTPRSSSCDSIRSLAARVADSSQPLGNTLLLRSTGLRRIEELDWWETAYTSFFKQIRERMGVVDLALLPIGAYEPRWFMQSVHLKPAEAVRAHLTRSISANRSPLVSIRTGRNRSASWMDQDFRSTSCTKEIAIDPSPTADATRFTFLARTSPTANTPGRLVSSR